METMDMVSFRAIISTFNLHKLIINDALYEEFKVKKTYLKTGNRVWSLSLFQAVVMIRLASLNVYILHGISNMPNKKAVPV